jgi:hypothetical protein
MEFFRRGSPPLREDAELILGAVNVLAEEIASQKQFWRESTNWSSISLS